MPRTKRMGHVRYGWQALGTIKCVKKKKKKNASQYPQIDKD